MKLPTLLTLSAALALTSCDQPQEVAMEAPKPAEAPKAEKKAEETQKTETAKQPAEHHTDEIFKKAANPVDVGSFGSDQPVERRDSPLRGVIVFGKKEVSHDPREHWEQWNWNPLKAKRSGRYQVRLTYTMPLASTQTQFRFGQQALKNTLSPTREPAKHYLGEIYVEQPGDYAFALFAPASAAEKKVEIHELALIPAPEGPMPTQGADGSITLEAKTATTWSENMRYEPKPEKNCLGYWTSEDDLAEWEFEVTKPGKFHVSVFYGCGGDNHGSEVAVKSAGQELKFITADTGGFQKWQEAKLGNVEITKAGKTFLVIDPLNKVKAAVLDVQRVVLTPAG
jgi:hypothetical protein